MTDSRYIAKVNITKCIVQLKEIMANSKFQCINQIFITATESINYLDVQNYLLPKISRNAGTFAKGTIFYLLAGIHHHPSAKEDGKPSETDPTLLSSFHYTLFNNLSNFCGYLECKSCQEFRIDPCSSSVWNDMEYEVEVIPLYTLPISDDSEDEEEIYELSKMSKNSLNSLSKKLRNQTSPSALIFASCYSMYSDITNILMSNGVLACMNISKDKGEVTEGKAFHLDTQQRKIIRQLSEIVCMFQQFHL